MSEYNNLIRTALIGFGFVGKTFHAPLIRSVPGLELSVVSSRHPEKVREDLPAAKVVADPEEAATHSEVDLVVIASPNETHVPLATAALSAGKHVVVDKPFTITLAEARRLGELSQAKGRLLSVFQNRRWDSEFLAARTIIEEGRLGEVLHFESRLDRFRPEVRKRWREVAGPGAGLWVRSRTPFGRPSPAAIWIARKDHGKARKAAPSGADRRLVSRLARLRAASSHPPWFANGGRRHCSHGYPRHPRQLAEIRLGCARRTTRSRRGSRREQLGGGSASGHFLQWLEQRNARAARAQGRSPPILFWHPGRLAQSGTESCYTPAGNRGDGRVGDGDRIFRERAGLVAAAHKSGTRRLAGVGTSGLGSPSRLVEAMRPPSQRCGVIHRRALERFHRKFPKGWRCRSIRVPGFTGTPWPLESVAAAPNSRYRLISFRQDKPLSLAITHRVPR